MCSTSQHFYVYGWFVAMMAWLFLMKHFKTGCFCILNIFFLPLSELCQVSALQPALSKHHQCLDTVLEWEVSAAECRLTMRIKLPGEKEVRERLRDLGNT